MGLIHLITRRPLSDFVDFLWMSEGYVQPHAAERILPTGRMDLVINLDESQGWRALASGARSTSMVLATVRPLTLIGVGFKPGGGFAFFPCPAGELQNSSAPLETLWGPTANTLREQLLEAVTPPERFAILEARLLERLRVGPHRHPAIQYALATFQNGPTTTTVADIVERTGLSARKLIDLFRGQVGLTPKVFSRMCRFRLVIGSINTRTSANVDWVQTALACGYFDQPHFIHDFRDFAGMSPAAYLRHRTTNPNHVRVAD
jgi:AraC-like DNA-binding protein